MKQLTKLEMASYLIQSRLESKAACRLEKSASMERFGRLFRRGIRSHLMPIGSQSLDLGHSAGVLSTMGAEFKRDLNGNIDGIRNLLAGRPWFHDMDYEGRRLNDIIKDLAMEKKALNAWEMRAARGLLSQNSMNRLEQVSGMPQAAMRALGQPSPMWSAAAPNRSLINARFNMRPADLSVVDPQVAGRIHTMPLASIDKYYLSRLIGYAGKGEKAAPEYLTRPVLKTLNNPATARTINDGSWSATGGQGFLRSSLGMRSGNYPFKLGERPNFGMHDGTNYATEGPEAYDLWNSESNPKTLTRPYSDADLARRYSNFDDQKMKWLSGIPRTMVGAGDTAGMRHEMGHWLRTRMAPTNQDNFSAALANRMAQSDPTFLRRMVGPMSGDSNYRLSIIDEMAAHYLGSRTTGIGGPRLINASLRDYTSPGVQAMPTDRLKAVMAHLERNYQMPQTSP